MSRLYILPRDESPLCTVAMWVIPLYIYIYRNISCNFKNEVWLWPFGRMLWAITSPSRWELQVWFGSAEDPQADRGDLRWTGERHWAVRDVPIFRVSIQNVDGPSKAALKCKGSGPLANPTIKHVKFALLGSEILPNLRGIECAGNGIYKASPVGI